MCMDTTIIHYLENNSKKGGKKGNTYIGDSDREARANEAINYYLERKAQKEKDKNTTTIKLK